MKTRVTRTAACAVLVALLAPLAVGQGTGASSSNDEEYKALLDEYFDLTEQHDKLLENAKNADPALARSMEWLEDERLERSTPFAAQEREFLSALQTDQQKLYRNWKRGVAAELNMDVFEKEWNEHPSSHQALLFWAGVTIAQLAKADKKEGRDSSDSLAAPEMKGPEARQWDEFIQYARQHESEFVAGAPRIAEEISIPRSLIDNFEITASDTALFNVYDTYYRLNYPKELAANEKEQTRIRKELTKLNPNWQYDEKIEFPTESEAEGPTKLVRRESLWLPVLLGGLFILVVLFFIYRGRKRRG